MKVKNPTTGEYKELVIKANDSIPENGIIEYDGDVVPEGYEKVEDKGYIYSTEEQRIGTWIDGKPLYRKVINTTSLSNSYEDFNIHLIADVKVMANINNRYLFNSSRYDDSTDIYEWFIDTQSKTIEISVGSAWTFNMATIILEYTKTTD